MILKHSAKILMWVSYGFLVTPEHFSMPEPLEILKVALQQSYLTPCYGSEVRILYYNYLKFRIIIKYLSLSELKF